MIHRLQNNKIEVAEKIQSVFQLSYKVEAQLLNVSDFAPLKRSLNSYMNSNTEFYGFYQHQKMAGIIELTIGNGYIYIDSLVVNPQFFRQGIAKSLLQFVLDTFESKLILVETGVDNEPATKLYKQFNFKEINQWNTATGIRKIKFEHSRSIKI